MGLRYESGVSRKLAYQHSRKQNGILVVLQSLDLFSITSKAIFSCLISAWLSARDRAAEIRGIFNFNVRVSGVDRSISLGITELPLYKNLRGEITIRFPRNAWIRSGDVNIEINGDLTATKEGHDIVLFGSLSTLRGFYQLLGRRFQIEEGQIVFKGKPEPDPDVSIEAVHEFRDDTGPDSEIHEFKVLVSGTLNLPKFRFELDGQEAKQKDVISVLLFGQRSENRTPDQNAGVSESSGLDDRAAGILTTQALGKLTGTIGQKLNLDVIQFERGADWKDTKVKVGKYLTPDVFVSVSQDFSTEGSRRVELEYEIPLKIRLLNLFLQASTEGKENSAMDVIWKFEW